MSDAPRSSAARGYGKKWQQARVVFLRANPFCAFHRQRGELVAATVVDHIVPHRGDYTLFWRRSNWQPLCDACHSSLKQREERGGAAGFDADGVPLGVGHHWAAAAAGSAAHQGGGG